MNTLEYIDDYFKGLLTDEEKIQFERRILSDSVFAEELAFYISAGNLLKEELAAEKKARFRELYEQGHAAAQGRIPLRRLWPYAAAASVLIALIGSWWIFFRHESPEKLADQYIAEQLQNLPVKMNSVQDSLQKAISLYNAKDLPEALSQFQRILQRDTANEMAKQFAGIVCLRLGEYDKALYYFRQLETDSSLYINPALFYQSLTLLKRQESGDPQRARQLLQKVVDNNLDKKEDAQQFLKNW
jgi:tetratricopeptide (TPR) repeat protein